MEIREFLNLILSIGTIAAQVLIGLIIFALLSSKFRNYINPIFNFFKDKAILIAFLISLSATLISLFYSDVLGYEPCKLCWIQRIFIYPQVIIFGLALYKKDKNVMLYGIALSIIGAVVAFYHNMIQLGFKSPFPCSALGDAVSCTQNYVLEFGYITIPMMSFTVFVLIVVTLFCGLRANKENNV